MSDENNAQIKLRILEMSEYFHEHDLGPDAQSDRQWQSTHEQEVLKDYTSLKGNAATSKGGIFTLD